MIMGNSIESVWISFASLPTHYKQTATTRLNLNYYVWRALLVGIISVDVEKWY